jgi:hypothetical protein
VANFIFNWATAALAAATLDLSTGNYYAHLVTTVPAFGHSTVADLVLPTTSSYASTPLTGLSYNSTRWTFDSFSFPKYSFASAPTGVVICKRNGATPATTDGIVCYSDFNNSIGQAISLQVGVYVVNLQFGSNGAINFSYRYQYSSGIYSNTEPIPKGIIHLIGSQNNTITFSNPTPSKLAGTGTNAAFLTDRIQTSQYNQFSQRYGFDFINNKVRVGTFGFYGSQNATTIVTLWGSNNSSGDPLGTMITNEAPWTQIGVNPSVGTPLSFSFINSNNTEYWRYIRLTSSSASLNLFDIEFYNSSVISPTLNLV